MVSPAYSARWYKSKDWHFDKDGDFVDKNGQLFDFESQGEHYEYVQTQIKKHIYEELQHRFDFVRQPLPISKFEGVSRDDSQCPQIFVTKDIQWNPDLLVIVQGLGEVPPGQWARKLFTNGESGQWGLATQFAYIQKALHRGWAVLLCDPNHDGNGPKTQHSRSRHVRRVWDDIISRSNARCVMFVAFSAGTTATLDLYESLGQEFTNRVQAIALLDGEDGTGRTVGKDGGRWLREHSWSFMNKNIPLQLVNQETVSTTDHDSVPGMAVGKVFEFLVECHSYFEATLLPDEFDRYKHCYVIRSAAEC
ncbi:hypothetical protein BC939DRAFT_455869 [Gamsiella multidivaricata]|uniref:uncharacterized protein n=1 Tax=Gamsiella multidivaricata TaxID=101098 RepID=UPI00221ED3CA|nr:uncharacterized protein BC939DRAFT_455869 [Gamsiella multidivaricata]KAI7821392.1 hypothetical protein BC939DRAFT_455869 [Gamsiella multidivaricata]